MTDDRKQRYRQSPKGQYQRQKERAKARGVAFELSFDQWWQIWTESGCYDQRGNKQGGQYVMCRKGDAGPYASSNVYIATSRHNLREAIYTRHGNNHRQVTFSQDEPSQSL